MHFCCLFSHPKQLFKLLISGLCFVFNRCVSCYCFLSISGMLGLPSQLPWSPCPPEKQLLGAICVKYMHLTTLSLSPNPIAKVIFSAHCPTPVTPLFFAQCHWPPFFTVWNTNDFSLLFKPCLIYITRKYLSLPLWKRYQYFKAVLYIHFHAFTHAADYA